MFTMIYAFASALNPAHVVLHLNAPWSYPNIIPFPSQQ